SGWAPSYDCLRLDEHRQRHGERSARAVRAVACGNGAVHRLDETATDRETQPGAGTPPVRTADAIELVEHTLQVGGRNTRTLVQHLHHDMPAILPRLEGDQRFGRRILAGVIQQV